MVSTLVKKSFTKIIAAAGIGLLAGFVLFRSGDSFVTAQQATPSSITIAALNLNMLVSQLDEHTADDNTMKQKIADYQSQLANKKTALQNLQAPLDPSNTLALKPGTQEYEDQENKVLEASMALQTFDNFTQEELRLDQLEEEEDLYRHINAAVAQYAQSHNISLVLITDDINYQVSQEQDLITQIASRKVMYADSSLDITNALAQQMNSDYERASGGPAPTPAPMPGQ